MIHPTRKTMRRKPRSGNVTLETKINNATFWPFRNNSRRYTFLGLFLISLCIAYFEGFYLRCIEVIDYVLNSNVSLRLCQTLKHTVCAI